MDTEGDADQINLGWRDHAWSSTAVDTWSTLRRTRRERTLNKGDQELEDENKWTEFGLDMVWAC